MQKHNLLLIMLSEHFNEQNNKQLHHSRPHFKVQYVGSKNISHVWFEAILASHFIFSLRYFFKNAQPPAVLFNI